jgi:hypothetical protein
LPWIPVPATSRPVVTSSQLPERALRIPETRQFDASARSPALAKAGVCAPSVKVARCVRFCGQLPRSKSGSSGFRYPLLICGNPLGSVLPTQRDRV